MIFSFVSVNRQTMFQKGRFRFLFHFKLWLIWVYYFHKYREMRGIRLTKEEMQEREKTKIQTA